MGCAEEGLRLHEVEGHSRCGCVALMRELRAAEDPLGGHKCVMYVCICVCTCVIHIPTVLS